jgi:hypothetical protein
MLNKKNKAVEKLFKTIEDHNTEAYKIFFVGD